MDRRDFFKSLAITTAAAFSPAIFIPKFEPVHWKTSYPWETLDIHWSFNTCPENNLFEELKKMGYKSHELALVKHMGPDSFEGPTSWRLRCSGYRKINSTEQFIRLDKIIKARDLVLISYGQNQAVLKVSAKPFQAFTKFKQ